MSTKVIAIDLDGTLLNNNSQLSPFTKETIQKISKKGHHVIITTGRPYRMALDFYKELELQTPMINFNGSLTHIPEQKWEFEQSVPLDKSFLLDLVKREEEIEADFIASEYRRKFYITNTDEDVVNPALFGIDSFKEHHQLQSALVTSNPNAILMQTRVEDKYALADELNHFYKNQLSINTWGGPLNILECSAKGVHKAFALEYLLKVLNKDRNDLIAFGDEQNDTQMLAFAGTGYAMKNANPTLLPYADEQLSLTNEEDGVAHELMRLFL
ncbi:Cof-type HAD-IIB family hydrolase [Streptococcus himalayensis]|uniref:Haloacid dehalogenase n=1 Tax=Streptococcus himalayensis TaxID=1888195 RepID=A0A917A870_9STRE|nr:Cof-type HAD-IIB family hydrolase [Streptococcus himalayensis]GGE34988.1 haloacid dehalogenase [Streptococcus himalayensis]